MSEIISLNNKYYLHNSYKGDLEIKDQLRMVKPLKQQGRLFFKNYWECSFYLDLKNMNFIYSKKNFQRERKHIIDLNVQKQLILLYQSINFVKDMTDYKMDESSPLWYIGFTIYWKPQMNQEQYTIFLCKNLISFQQWMNAFEALFLQSSNQSLLHRFRSKYSLPELQVSQSKQINTIKQNTMISQQKFIDQQLDESREILIVEEKEPNINNNIQNPQLSLQKNVNHFGNINKNNDIAQQEEINTNIIQIRKKQVQNQIVEERQDDKNQDDQNSQNDHQNPEQDQNKMDKFEIINFNDF